MNKNFFWSEQNVVFLKKAVESLFICFGSGNIFCDGEKYFRPLLLTYFLQLNITRYYWWNIHFMKGYVHDIAYMKAVAGNVICHEVSYCIGDKSVYT